MWPGLAFAPKQLHLSLFFWQTAQLGQKVTERSQINSNKNLLLLLTYYVFYPQCTTVFFTAAQNQAGYVSDRLDVDLKASTDTTLSILQCCRAVYMEMGAIFLSSVIEGIHAASSRFAPPASKPRTCSYWIFYKELFHCDSSNPEPFTVVMSYLPTVSPFLAYFLECSHLSIPWCSHSAVCAQHVAWSSFNCNKSIGIFK